MIDQVLGGLAQIPALAGLSLDHARIEPLPSLTNRTWKVTIGPESFALRVAGQGTERYIDREVEAYNAGIATSIGVAPEIIYCEPATGVMLTRLVAGGVALRASDLSRVDTISQCARLLKRLHGSWSPFKGEMRLFPKLDRYLQMISRSDAAARFGLTDVRRDADLVRQVFERRPVPLVPSHVDPVPENFVADSERLYLVDWEYSAMAEPLWDLAGLALEAELDQEQERLLLATYFDAVAPETAARFELYKSSLLLLAAAWAVVQMVDGNPNGDFAAFARERLSRHQLVTRGAAHAEALALLAR